MRDRTATSPRSFSRALSAVVLSCILLAACQSTPEHAVAPVEPVNAIDYRVWFEAADEGNVRVLAALLEEGIDALVERRGLTALHIVARHGHLDAVRLLIEAGVDVNIEPDQAEAQLAAAAGHGDPGMLELLTGVEFGPQDVAYFASLRSPLNLAVENGHYDTVALLVERGADVNSRGEWYSPLHSALIYGDAGTVELLLDNGARVRTKIRIHDRSTFAGFRYVGPLELAQIIGRDDLVDLLRRHGARY